jgi:succinate dehydrogenase/fumarate reductase flavoprotein subunit
MKVYETDVLIIGGGGAATASAISAHERGARTTIAVKGRFGVPGVRGAGATSNPIADFWTIRTVGPQGSFFNPPDSVHADMVQAGLGMADPELCRIFVDEVSAALQRLQEMGMRFQSKMLAKMDANPEAGQTNSIVAIQKAVIEATQTFVIEHANLTDLIVESNRCLGAVGVDDEGRPFVVHAGAVVIATGGVGQLFKHSFNPPGNTGDGYAMALRAGAELFNMEFMQQGLATTWPVQAMIMLYEMEEPYRLVNGEGKAFVKDYLPPGVTLEEVSRLKALHWPVSCRDEAIHLDRAIKGEVLAGRGSRNDGVFLDLSRADRGFDPETFNKFMRERGFDVEQDLIQVQLHHHTSNGGIRIDADAQSSVEGLFATGEAAGWQGADRLGGTMLGGSQVFGWRAGAKAAEVAGRRPVRHDGQETVERLAELIARFRESRGEAGLAELRSGLQQVMWETLLVEKDAGSLARARRYADDGRDRLARHARIDAPLDVAIAFEHRNLLDVATVIASAAAMRTESRGSHYRRDYPHRDDEQWLTNVFVRRSGKGEIELRKQWVAEGVGWEDRQGDIRIRPWG